MRVASLSSTFVTCYRFFSLQGSSENCADNQTRPAAYEMMLCAVFKKAGPKRYVWALYALCRSKAQTNFYFLYLKEFLL